MVCKNCEKELQDVDNYCSHCGTKVEDNLNETLEEVPTAKQRNIPLPEELTRPLFGDATILPYPVKEAAARDMAKDFYRNAWKETKKN